MDEEIVRIISVVILLVGALGCATFVIDYVRTVNLSDKYARMLISLNTSIALILFIAIFNRVSGFANQELHLVVQVILFLWLDYFLWYQWFLLRKARREWKNYELSKSSNS